MSAKKNQKWIWLIITTILAITFIVLYVIGMPNSNIKRNVSYSLWFVNRESSDEVFGYVNYIYNTSHLASASETALYQSILSQLVQQPENPKFRSVFPKNTDVYSVYMNDKTLKINFGSQFYEMSEYEISLAKYCIAKTFSVFDNIAEISISVNGKPIESNNAGIYDINDYITEHSQLHPQKTEITFYKLTDNKQGLKAERKEITWYPHNSLPEQVIKKLLEDNAGSAIPAGATVNYIYQTGSTVYVGFSPEFGSYTNERGTLAMYSVINTLASISDVSKVEISLSGEMNYISNIPLDTPLLPNMSYVYKE